MEKNILNFKKFLEASIEGNPGIPDGYLSDRGNKEKDDLELPRDIDNPNNPPNRYGQLAGQNGGRLMALVGQSIRLTNGKEKELEELALKVIREYYKGSLIDDIKITMKLIKPGEVKDFMDEEDEDEDSDFPEFRQLQDEKTIEEIHKRKLANNVMQGEAKNTKQLIDTTTCRDGLIEIYGETTTNQILEIWREITNIANKMDWIIPVGEKGAMMEENPEGLSGACSVKWERPDDQEDEDEEPVDLTEMDDEDFEYNDEFVDALEEGNVPVIKSVGIDFPMLIHETIKGIYILLRTASDQNYEDETIARNVEMNTTSKYDEAEEFKYGPMIAADLRDFINENPLFSEIDENDNVVWGYLRLNVFRKLMEMDSYDFLQLFKGILSKTPKARRDIDSIIEECRDEEVKYKNDLEEYERGESEEDYGSSYDDNDDEFANSENDEEDDVLSNIQKSNQVKEDDYSTWSKEDLQTAQDDAIDSGDYELAHKISQFIK